MDRPSAAISSQVRLFSANDTLPPLFSYLWIGHQQQSPLRFASSTSTSSSLSQSYQSHIYSWSLSLNPISLHPSRFADLDRHLQISPICAVPSSISQAVCLDGSVPAYHFHHGWGSGANSWIVDLEGGGWCNNIRTCAYRKNSRHGSSKYMAKILQFNGILSSDPNQNSDFYNWNRVRINYCDGGSFAGEGYNQDHDLYF